jgi:hypothetical protein
MVIGTTYAKFTSTISGNSTVRAAGFLITGSTASVDDELLIAPGETQEVEIELKYFSQVDTVISGEALQTNTAGNTGAFTDSNWAAIVAYYKAHASDLKNYFGITYSAQEATENTPAVIPGGVAFEEGEEPAVADLISVDDAAMVSSFLKKINDNNTTTGLGEDALAVYPTGSVVKAMAYDVTDPITIGLTIPVTWTTHAVGGDTFDTLVGNCIAALAAPDAGYATVSHTEGSTSVVLDFGFGSGNELTLTLPSNSTTGIASKVSVALGMTATQYTGAAIAAGSWVAPSDGGVGA